MDALAFLFTFNSPSSHRFRRHLPISFSGTSSVSFALSGPVLTLWESCWMPNNVHTYIRSHLSSPDLSIGLRAAWQKAAYHLRRCSCPGAKIALDTTLYKPSIKRYSIVGIGIKRGWTHRAKHVMFIIINKVNNTIPHSMRTINQTNWQTINVY